MVTCTGFICKVRTENFFHVAKGQFIENALYFQVISEVRPTRAGLGMKKDVKFQMSRRQENKNHVLEITRQRFQEAEMSFTGNGNQGKEAKK